MQVRDGWCGRRWRVGEMRDGLEDACRRGERHEQRGALGEETRSQPPHTAAPSSAADVVAARADGFVPRLLASKRQWAP
jgi:hypothetical protein